MLSEKTISDSLYESFARASTSTRVVNHAQRLATLSAEVLNACMVRLNLILQEPDSMLVDSSDSFYENCQDPLPPLYQELRGNLLSIESALTGIIAVLKRVDL